MKCGLVVKITDQIHRPLPNKTQRGKLLTLTPYFGSKTFKTLWQSRSFTYSLISVCYFSE